MSRPSAIRKFGWITRVSVLLVALLLAGSFNAHATWTYTYNSVYDVGIWSNNGIARMRYWYGVTAWEQYAQWGGWQMLGNYGWSPVARNDATPANFIGDGTYRNMGNGWSFAYSASGDYSGWMRAADGNVRFSYAFSTGQWNDVYTPTSTWAFLGAADMSSAFVGDGTYRNVGNGWIFGYYAGGDAGYWKRASDSVMRFAYSFSAGQWNDVYTPTNSWAVVGTGGVGPAFIGDGAYWNVGNGWLFAYSVGGDYSGWKLPSKTRFSYSYSAGQWNDFYTPTNSWAVVGTGGVGPAFIGDGAYWNVGNGWLFAYSVGGDYSGWKLASSGQTRFSYYFQTGQWWDLGNYGSWSALGSTNLSCAFVGDGNWHDIGTINGIDWQYSFDGTYGNWTNASLGLVEFAYNYGTGQWLDQGVTGGLQTLSYTPMSAAFVGDGTTYDIGTAGYGVSWQYSFDGTSGNWYNTTLGITQFAYNYGTSLWSDQGTYGGLQALGGQLSAEFLGDGSFHSIGTTQNGVNWQYQFDGTSGNWYNSTLGITQFAYAYDTGQWQDQGEYGSLQILSYTPMSAAFVGDGTTYDIGTINSVDWKYSFDGTCGNWTNPGLGSSGLIQFAYNYDTGQWQDQGVAGGSQVLSPTGFSALFIGNGDPHSLDADWSYAFSGTTGTWTSTSLGRDLFNYNYSTGQWQDEGSDLTWQNLGPTGLSAAFLGDGSSHTLDSTWSYIFSGTTGTWTNATLGRSLFAYDYVNGVWQDRGWDLAWQVLGYANVSGPTNYSAAFMGDGNSHILDPDWSYKFTGTTGTWINATLGRALFGYDYADGQWLHYDATTSGDLGSNHKSRSYFIGDGYWHNVGSASEGSWSFMFNHYDMAGLFGWTALGLRFTYDYTNGHWLTDGYSSSTLQLGTLKLDTWVGDGNPHNMGNGWQFKFGYGADRATFSNSGYTTQFAYDYATGQWNHLYAGTFYTLGNSGRPISDALYDGNKHLIPIGSQNAYYQFVTGTIDGSPREAAYYYGADGQYVGLVYSYRVGGANEGRWGMYQGGNGAQLLWFTDAGLNPGVNFADGVWHTIYSGTEYQLQVKWLTSDLADEWWGWHDATTHALAQVGAHGALYFKGTAQGDSETYRYAAGDDVWNDQWNENSRWYLIASYNPSVGLHKYYATSLAAYFDYGGGLTGRYFEFNDTHGNDFSFLIGNGIYLNANYNMSGQNYTYIYDSTSEWGLPDGSYHTGLNPGYYR